MSTAMSLLRTWWEGRFGNGGTHLLFLILLNTFVLTIATTPVHGQQIWITPTDPMWRQIRHWPPNDFTDMFDENAPWQRTAAVVKGFELTKRFVMDGPDPLLTRVIEDLRRRNISLGVQGTPLLASRECGLGVEGHGPAHDMLAVAQRLKRFGADLRYVIFDEPLYYGHRFDGASEIRACHAPIKLLAQQAAAKMAELKQIFPDAEIGDIEPFGIPEIDQRTWTAEIAEWLREYAMAAGAPLAFFRADIVWRRPVWRAQFESAVALLRSVGMPLGVVYDGSPDAASDKEWTDAAFSNATFVECQLGFKRQHAVRTAG